MLAPQRQRAILELVRLNGGVRVVEPARAFGVSAATGRWCWSAAYARPPTRWSARSR
ncbi:hypothetical protein ACIBP6_18405 [Nonomuraea terrae]|uniref:hypothetical protein n=1 Tax=Nonomuraea terrae TaxID=2530383 RepID=UPI00378881C6